MKAVKLQLATRTLLNPAAQQWATVPPEDPTPLLVELQALNTQEEELHARLRESGPVRAGP